MGASSAGVTSTHQSRRTQRRELPLRLGFVPLVDCAPIVAARELGIFEKYGLKVALCRELGWATVRDKIVYGELDASHAVSGLAIAASLVRPCVSSLILSANGNGITLSNHLFSSGVRDAAGLKRLIADSRPRLRLVLGTVSPFSAHNFLLRAWLRSGGLDPDRDVRIVIVPPPQVCQNLAAGNLDGFCVGEPWNSQAVRSRVGWTVATSRDLSPGHPEKILLVREEFAEGDGERHSALVAALIEACEWCDGIGNRDELAAILAAREYLNLPAEVIRPSLSGRYEYGHGRVEDIGDFIVFHRGGTNDPTPEKVAWIARQFADNGFLRFERPADERCRRVFRRDLYRRALGLVSRRPLEGAGKG